MAAISVTATGVIPGSNAQLAQARAAATITAGQAVYLDATGKLNLAANNAALTAAAVGIALNGGAVNQVVDYVMKGQYTAGATLVQGQPYYVGTAGGIIPVDDIAGGEYMTLLGHALSTTVIDVTIKATGVTKTGAIA